MDIEDVRRSLMLSITGALAAGCGPIVGPPDVADGTATELADESGRASASTGATSSSATTEGTTQSTTPATTQADGDDHSPPKFDIGEMPDFGPFVPPPECPLQPMPPLEECTAELPQSHYFVFYCVDVLEGQTCEDWAQSFEDDYPEDWPGWITECLPGESCAFSVVNAIGCGPLPDSGDQCCFWFITETVVCPGRPFLVAGRERLAELCERDDWAAATTTVVTATVPPSTAEHAAIAAAWAEQALFEHASIASFSRFMLQLLACSAPPELLTATQVALGEEIEHARLFFELASHYAGHPVGPTALATHDALAAGDDFDEIVLATVREGCIAETISAWHVTLAAKSARDPAMKLALTRVAEQELEHAALAWRFLAWALPRASDSLRQRIAATLHAPARFAPRSPTLATTITDAQWRAHGILPAQEHAAAARHALRELVEPLAQLVLSAAGRSPGEQTQPAWSRYDA